VGLKSTSPVKVLPEPGQPTLEILLIAQEFVDERSRGLLKPWETIAVDPHRFRQIDPAFTLSQTYKGSTGLMGIA
jgi:hypothetical protein